MDYLSERKALKKKKKEQPRNTLTQLHVDTHTQIDAYRCVAFRNKQQQQNNNLHIHLKWNSQINCWVYTQKILCIYTKQ